MGTVFMNSANSKTFGLQFDDDIAGVHLFI